jgi:phosphoribosyl-AMP cyclohydrolase
LKGKKILNLDDLDFDKGSGLIPVIVQNIVSLEVLTLAYVNHEAIKKTVETGQAHFFRRSFGKVMKKGETSGNIVKEIWVDCDHDAIIYLVKPKGPACHLSKSTCFHNKLLESFKE